MDELFANYKDTAMNYAKEITDKKDNAVKQPAANNNIEELKQYKELLDSGVITEEEFNAKKKQLLNI